MDSMDTVPCRECGHNLLESCYEYGQTSYRQTLELTSVGWGERDDYPETDCPEGYGCTECGAEHSLLEHDGVADQVAAALTARGG